MAVKPQNRPKKTTATGSENAKHEFQFVFNRQNYILMITGLAMILLGFILMYGGKEDIYSFRKITLAPILVVGGFALEIFAILKKPSASSDGNA